MTPNTRSHDAPQQKKSDALHNGQTEGKENQWKFRAPYKIQNEESFKSRYEGSCHCGKIKFHIKKKEPLDAKYCHCTTCHALHGNIYI